jgi:hypothetical protein
MKISFAAGAKAWRSILLFCLLGCAGTAAAEVDGPLVDPPPLAVPTGVSQQGVVDSIKAGLNERGWKIDSEKPGVIEATVSASFQISATVDVVYDAAQVQVRYVDSKFMHFREENGQRKIAHRYLHWAQNLSQSIGNGLLRAAQDN